MTYCPYKNVRKICIKRSYVLIEIYSAASKLPCCRNHVNQGMTVFGNSIPFWNEQKMDQNYSSPKIMQPMDKDNLGNKKTRTPLLLLGWEKWLW